MLKQYRINKENERRARLFNIYHGVNEIIELKAPNPYGQFVRIAKPARATAGGVLVEINREPYLVSIDQLKTAVF